MSKNTRRRNQLLARGTTCHWCGVEVIYIHAKEWPKGTMPRNFATVDHLDDRLSCPDRGNGPSKPGERTTLACFACNMQRNRDQQLMMRLMKSGGVELASDAGTPTTRIARPRSIQNDRPLVETTQALDFGANRLEMWEKSTSPYFDVEDR